MKKQPNKNKLRYSLIEPEFIKQLAQVIAHGNEKYTPESWKNNNKVVYIDALLRHLMEYMLGNKVDPDSGLPHLSHAAVNIMMVAWFEEREYDPHLKAMMDCFESSGIK